MQYVEINDSDYPSKEKIWDRLYQCRDFELSHFWQKSVFLFTVVSLCFTGYGILALKVVDVDIKILDLLYIYQYMSGVSILGIVLSVIWIYMMKGSKAWYQVYENTIYEIEKEIFLEYENKSKYVMGQYVTRNKSNDTNFDFIGVNPGAFSPSKINIVIGWILFGVWIVCSFFSFFNLLCYYFKVAFQNFHYAWSAILSFALVLAISILAVNVPKKFIKSKPLSESKDSYRYLALHKYIAQNVR